MCIYLRQMTETHTGDCGCGLCNALQALYEARQATNAITGGGDRPPSPRKPPKANGSTH